MNADGQLRAGIIGCGLIGHKRAKALPFGTKLLACADMNMERAQALAAMSGARAFADWRELLALQDIDFVIISTLHDSLATITAAALGAGKHVLVEKPAARRAAELEPVLALADASGLLVRAGFNHRYHRAMRKARQLVDEGELGALMFLRARYGHGGRLGYDKEWRADPALSGGGELIDQGPHLIDLSRMFLGEFSHVEGFAHTYYWDMKVDDNGFMMLRTPEQKVAFLHVSCTEWKNMFSMEIYGRSGKLEISGLGGSYGVERLTWYKMLPEMGPPETTAWEYPMQDDSWAVELAEFCDDIRLGRRPAAGLADAHAALKIIEHIYAESGYDNRT